MTDSDLVRRAVNRHGGSRILAVMNARAQGDSWRLFIHGGREATGVDALAWTRSMCDTGVGAILANCLTRQGDTKSGYDDAFTQSVVENSTVTVIASGGCGSPQDMHFVRSRTGVAYALANTIFHNGMCSVRQAIEECGTV